MPCFETLAVFVAAVAFFAVVFLVAAFRAAGFFAAAFFAGDSFFAAGFFAAAFFVGAFFRLVVFAVALLTDAFLAVADFPPADFLSPLLLGADVVLAAARWVAGVFPPLEADLAAALDRDLFFSVGFAAMICLWFLPDLPPRSRTSDAGDFEGRVSYQNPLKLTI